MHNTVSEIQQPCHTFPGILLKLRNPARQRDGGHYCAKTQHLQVTLPLPCAHFPLRDPGSRLWGSIILPEPPRAGCCLTSPAFPVDPHPGAWHSASLGQQGRGSRPVGLTQENGHVPSPQTACLSTASSLSLPRKPTFQPSREKQIRSLRTPTGSKLGCLLDSPTSKFRRLETFVLLGNFISSMNYSVF